MVRALLGVGRQILKERKWKTVCEGSSNGRGKEIKLLSFKLTRKIDKNERAWMEGSGKCECVDVMKFKSDSLASH